MQGVAAKPWFPFGLGPVLASHRLFCLPFAGGGATFFLPWRKVLTEFAVVPVQYPGRETRMNEACHRVFTELVDDLAQALLPQLDRPYLIFGYSVGARVGFALCHRLVELGAASPALFIAAAHHAPDAPVRTGVPAMSDEEFWQHILRYGGMPEIVLQDPELREMLLPILRADIGLVEQGMPTQSLHCPILAYCGDQDATATPAGMNEWQRFTSAGFAMRTLPGGHFFGRTAQDFLPALADDVSGVLGGGAAAIPLAEPAGNQGQAA